MSIIGPFDLAYLIVELTRFGETRRASPILAEAISGEVLLGFADVLSAVDSEWKPSASIDPQEGVNK